TEGVEELRALGTAAGVGVVPDTADVGDHDRRRHDAEHEQGHQDLNDGQALLGYMCRGHLLRLRLYLPDQRDREDGRSAAGRERQRVREGLEGLGVDLAWGSEVE